MVVVPPGAPIVSDPVDLKLAPLSSVAVSIYLPEKTALTSVHWDGAQTGFISGPGDATGAMSFAAASTLKQRLFLSGIQVDAAPDSRALVFFGDSITDGACSTADANARWPDHIAERLLQSGHRNVTVVNEAFSGNRVLMNGMGTNALARLNQDVLSQPRLATVVLMMGINDIGWPGANAITPADQEPSADDIIMGYQQIIDRVACQGRADRGRDFDALHRHQPGHGDLGLLHTGEGKDPPGGEPMDKDQRPLRRRDRFRPSDGGSGAAGPYAKRL